MLLDFIAVIVTAVMTLILCVVALFVADCFITDKVFDKIVRFINKF